jgi:hypothetical protein
VSTSTAAPATRPRRPHPARTLALPLGLLTVLFLAFVLPPYLGLDPAQARLPLPVDAPWYYPALVAHIGFGSVALLAAVLQVWPWLRRRHPVVHRWSGRAYVFAGVLPGGLVVLAVTPFSVSGGVVAHVANTVLALLWLLTTAAGYRAARRRRYAQHREWMVRSVALAFSIVANRVWSVVCIAAFAPEVLAGGPVDQARLAAAVGASTWLSWVVNLLVVEYWLHRTRTRRSGVSS